MSLEKRRETKKPKKENSLEDSSFRQNNFVPLALKVKIKEKEEEVTVSKEDVLKESEEVAVSDELTEIEKDVLEIAKKILKLKRYDADFDVDIESADHLQKYPIIEKLYAKCIAKLSYKKGYSKDEIFLAIRELERKSWIVTKERRTKLEVLENEKLVKIINFIDKYPGIHARDGKVEKELGITRTPFLKHIMILERFKIIRSNKIGKTLHYFISDVPDKLDKYRVIFLNPMIPKIIEEFFKSDTIAISKIGEIIDVYSGTVQYHVKKLKELNLLKDQKNQSGKKIHLINIELLKKYNKVFKEPDFSNLLKGL